MQASIPRHSLSNWLADFCGKEGLLCLRLFSSASAVWVVQGKLDLRFKGGGGGWGFTGATWLDPPPKKGSRDGTPKTNPGTSHVSMQVGGRGGGGLFQGAEWGNNCIPAA